MDQLSQFIFANAHLAHWIFFCALLLAGLNIPLCADLIILLAAILAANVIPENKIILFCSILFGCIFSAWISYWFGRILGAKLLKIPFFAKIISEKRIAQTKVFYEKYGLWTLIVGRFIPFGARNCIFMSTGMSKIPFQKFVIRDLCACTIWTSTLFFLFFALGQNYELLCEKIKTFNILIFAVLGVSVIGLIWYKKRKKLT